MPGNEVEVTRYIYSKIGQIKLDHIGLVEEVGFPLANGTMIVRNIGDISNIAPDDSNKKADIYINGHGVSIKQAGGSFAFNRLQRKNLLDLFSYLGFGDPEVCLAKLDSSINNFHNGAYASRNRDWGEFFSEGDFRTLMRHLMMVGSPNIGISSHPAEYILEAPPFGISEYGIGVYTFDEYFEKYKRKFVIAMRRVWKGQKSNSEHNRALSITREPGNSKWVFESISGSPRDWRDDFPISERRTAYYLMIEKIK